MSSYIGSLRKLVGNEKLILVTSSVLVMNEKKEILLQKTDDGFWGVPGGYMNLGESVQDTAHRNITGKSGLILNKLELFGIYSGSDKDFTLENGDEVSIVKTLFKCKDFTGTLNNSDMKFFPIKNLPDNVLHRQHYIFRDLKRNTNEIIID